VDGLNQQVLVLTAVTRVRQKLGNRKRREREIKERQNKIGLAKRQCSRIIFGRCPVRISVGTPAILRIFVVFLSPSR
jgi:hypothetical protein